MSPLIPLIEEVARIFEKTSKPFWLAGGYSLDCFLGRRTREHEDLDFVVRREDQIVFQKILKGWDLQAADPPGTATLYPWAQGHFYQLPVHNIWCRKDETSPWDLEILFSEFEGEEWVYRRNKAIRGPLKSFEWEIDSGLKVLAPEIQLLYKSRSQRPKDYQDLENCLPVLKMEQIETLKNWIAIDSGFDHPWLKFLETTQLKNRAVPPNLAGLPVRGPLNERI